MYMKKYFAKKSSFKFLLSILMTFNFCTSEAGTFYWVGGSGNWSDYQHHWATSSGGATFQVHPPTLIDDVVFDNNSFLASFDSVNIDVDPTSCKTFDWSVATGNQTITSSTINNTLEIYGSCKLNSMINWY